jgi:flagellar biosynthesis protein
MSKATTENNNPKLVDKDKSAVALKYDRGKDPAPKMVAKGKGVIAEQIVKVALDNNIEVREDADLVEVLEKLDIDAIIPLDAYAAVAEILSYVYKTNAKARANLDRKNSPV